MVKQGDIIKISFDPQAGHEQAGYRPAVVISSNSFNKRTNFAILCPITNTNNHFPLHIPLDQRTITTGVILCEQIKSMNIETRTYKVIEALPKDLLKKVINIVLAEIDYSE